MTLLSPGPQVHFATPEITEQDVEAVVSVLRSGWLTTGTVARAFEEDLAEQVGARHVVTTSSCTTALECAVAALHLPPGARVAVPAWTFVSTVTVLVRLGLRPVLVDSDPDTLNLSVPALERAVRTDLQAVLPVHFGGTPVSEGVWALAAAAGLPVVEDCAHALGTRLPPLAGARARCYSFYATKNLTTAEGGALATDDDELAHFARTYRLHGMSKDAWRRYEPGALPTYDLEQAGIKANLPDLLAALGRSQLRRFSDMQLRRRAAVLHYRALLAQVPGVRLAPSEPDPDSADHLLVVVLPEGVERDDVVRSMARDGVTASVHFRPVHHFAALRDLVEVGPGLPTCDALADRVLSLPLHATLASRDVERVVSSLADALAGPRW